MSPFVVLPLIFLVSFAPMYYVLYRYWKRSQKVPRAGYSGLDLLLSLVLGVAYSLPGLVVGLLLYLLSYFLA